MTHSNTQSPTSLTSTATVRKCGACREPGHNRRTCPTLSVEVAPVVVAPTPDPMYADYCACGENGYKTCICTPTPTFEDIDLHIGEWEPEPTVETRTYDVGCFITLPDNSTQEATPDEFADMMLHVRDVWDDNSPVVTGMRKSYLTPEDAQCAMGSISAYTSEVCPTCGAVYSGADIEAHLYTHTSIALLEGLSRTASDMSDKVAYAAHYATRALGCYMSESEGLSDTTELSDAHVRESGKQLSVDVIKAPTRECISLQCMQNCEDNPLVTKTRTSEGSSYKCVHGTTWNEVWEQSYTHARWDHLRDAHLQEQTYSDNIGHFGSNPIFAYLSRQKHTRTERMRQLTTWVSDVSLGGLMKSDVLQVLKGRRNLTVAQAVGFATTPVGKWEGVSGSDTCGLVRDFETTVTYTHTQIPMLPRTVSVKATCRRVAEWSGIYLTKEDFAYITTLVTNKLTGKPSTSTPAQKPTSVQMPTSRQVVRAAPTKGDTLLQRRLFVHTLRLDSTRWDMSAPTPQVGNGVPAYVNVADKATLHTLGYISAQ